jgi:GcrA cell cycle regulator
MGNNQNHTWTEERTAKFRALYAEGLSHRRIAAELGGISRNASIGKAGRMGLEPRGPKGTGGRRAKHTALLAGRPPKPRTHGFNIRGVFELPVEIPTDQAVLFLDVKADQCRWPVEGEGVAMVCCGNATVRGRPYCAGHCRMAYVQPKPRPVRAWTTNGKAA